MCTSQIWDFIREGCIRDFLFMKRNFFRPFRVTISALKLVIFLWKCCKCSVLANNLTSMLEWCSLLFCVIGQISIKITLRTECVYVWWTIVNNLLDVVRNSVRDAWYALIGSNKSLSGRNHMYYFSLNSHECLLWTTFSCNCK